MTMSDTLSFSEYTHTFERDDVTAVFHSLKMQPVYFDSEYFREIKEYVASGLAIVSGNEYLKCEDPKMKRALDALVTNRVLQTDSNRDEQVIAGFRNSLAKPDIKIAYFILADGCNLGCKYCFENIPSSSPLKSGKMSKNTAMMGLDFYEAQLAKSSSHEDKDIIFYGGEPLLNYSTLIYLLNEIHLRKVKSPTIWDSVRTSIVTNGTLLTPDRAKELKHYGLSISISVDGPQTINDANRRSRDGLSVFREILSGINACKSAGLEFGLSVTLSEIAVNNYRQVMDFILETNPSSVGFNILMSSDHEGDLGDDYNRDAARFLINAFQEFREIGLYEDRMMRKVKSFVKSQVYPFDCAAAGGNQIVIAPDGAIGICHGCLQGRKYFSTSVDNTEFDPTGDPVFMEWSKRTPLNMNACSRCPSLGICGGGCPLNAERRHGSMWDVDDRFCAHATTALEWLIWDLYTNAHRAAS